MAYAPAYVCRRAFAFYLLLRYYERYATALHMLPVFYVRSGLCATALRRGACYAFRYGDTMRYARCCGYTLMMLLPAIF